LTREHLVRRLTAIFAADVAGYSRLTGMGTHVRLKEHLRVLIDPKIAAHRGHIVKNTGDGLLAEFKSVVDAIRCAVDVQRGTAERNSDVPPNNRIEFRIGMFLRRRCARLKLGLVSYGRPRFVQAFHRAGPGNSSNLVYSIEFGFTSGAIVDTPCADHSHSRCPLPAPATYDARCRTAPGVSCQILFKGGIRLPVTAIDKLVDEQDRSQSRETNDVAATLIEELYQG
jgi:hypothetical protein